MESDEEESSTPNNRLMFKFNKHAGNWNCDVCLVSNKADVDKCIACETWRSGFPHSTLEMSTVRQSEGCNTYSCLYKDECKTNLKNPTNTGFSLTSEIGVKSEGLAISKQSMDCIAKTKEVPANQQSIEVKSLLFKEKVYTSYQTDNDAEQMSDFLDAEGRSKIEGLENEHKNIDIQQSDTKQEHLHTRNSVKIMPCTSSPAAVPVGKSPQQFSDLHLIVNKEEKKASEGFKYDKTKSSITHPISTTMMKSNVQSQNTFIFSASSGKMSFEKSPLRKANKVHAKAQDISTFNMFTSRYDKILCKFCRNEGLTWNVCEDCMIYFCDACMQKFHSNKIDHTISKSKLFSDFGCLIHLQIYRYFCPVCVKMKCDECIVSQEKCTKHGVVNLFRHIATERTSYRELVDKTSSFCSKKVNQLLEHLEEKEEFLMTRSMLNREILRQEFTSLRDLITEQELLMYKELDKELFRIKKSLREKWQKYGSVLEKDTEVLSQSWQELEKLSNLEFHQNFEKSMERLKKHQLALESLPPLDNLETSPLMTTPSLLAEKLRLKQILQITSLGESKKKAETDIQLQNACIACQEPICQKRSLFLCAKKVRSPIRISDLVSPADKAELYFHVTFSVEIRRPLKNVIWKKETCLFEEVIANSEENVWLDFRARYLFKLSIRKPLESMLTRAAKDFCSRPSHILIVTEGPDVPMDLEGERYFGIQMFMKDLQCSPSCKQNTSFEEERFRMTQIHIWQQQNIVPFDTAGSRGNSKAAPLKEFEERLSASTSLKSNSLSVGTTMKFKPPVGIEENSLSCKHQVITAMREYSKKSLEELRIEDYSAGRTPRRKFLSSLRTSRRFAIASRGSQNIM